MANPAHTGLRGPSVRLPPPPLTLGEESEGESPRMGRPCYEFNPVLRTSLDDTACEHCRFYLTHRCPHLDEFMDDLDDMSPDG